MYHASAAAKAGNVVTPRLCTALPRSHYAAMFQWRLASPMKIPALASALG